MAAQGITEGTKFGSKTSMAWREGKIAEVGLTERIKNLNVLYHNERPAIELQRTRVYTEVHQNTEGEPTTVRWAKALAKTIETLPVVINPYELIVGQQGRKMRSVQIIIEAAATGLKEEVDLFDQREYDPIQITEEEKKELKEIQIPYWEKRTLFHKWFSRCPEDVVKKTLGTGVIESSNHTLNPGSHFLPDYNSVLEFGFEGHKKKAQEKLAALDYSNYKNLDKADFYKAVIMICDAVRTLADRYSKKASELSREESDPTRKKELEKIAGICQRVPFKSSRTFEEAIQSVWLTFMLIYSVAYTGPGTSFGRFDQYMYPYYSRDKEEGRITDVQTQELLENLYIKTNAIPSCFIKDVAYYFVGYYKGPNLCIGGVNGRGQDVTNELSYLCIDAIADVRTAAPAVSILFHKESPQKLFLKTAELVQLGLGHPSCFNSDTLHFQLSQRNPGCSLEEILEKGSPIGCVEPGVQGKHYGHTDAGIMNFGSVMELVMNRGIKPLWSQGNGLGERIGLKTPDPRTFKDFNELMEATKAQMSYLIDVLTTALVVREKITAEEFPEILASILTEGMIEKGVDVSTQSAPMSIGGAVMGIGLADLTNSLMAINKLVFEEKAIPMDELCQALEKDFEGFEILRKRLRNAPKYGNDIDEVDHIARDLGDHFVREVARHDHYNGVKSVAGIQPTSANVPMGEMVGALPSGRKKGAPLADAASAEQGTDEKGITALIKSYGKLNHKYFSDGTVLNIWFDKSTLETEQGVMNFINLLRTYFDLGGYHLQFNCQDKETLLEAQKNPEKFPTLMVRVAGYSAYFVDLCQTVQNDLIARTIYSANK